MGASWSGSYGLNYVRRGCEVSYCGFVSNESYDYSTLNVVVRPVVCLKNEIDLIGNSEDGWSFVE